MRDAHGGLTSSKDSACGASIPTKFLAVSALSSILFSRAVQSLSRPRELRSKKMIEFHGLCFMTYYLAVIIRVIDPAYRRTVVVVDEEGR